MAMTTEQASKKWGISSRRIRLLCSTGKIEGAELIGKTWFIPINASKPVDGRIKKENSYLNRIIELKKELDSKRPLSSGELERLIEEFVTNYTYNSNAIEGNTLTLNETSLVLQGVTIDKKPLKDHLEAIGHKDAFYYILDLVKDKVELSEYIIRQIHYLVLSNLPQDRGVYRKIPVTIVGANHTPVSPLLIDEKMKDLLLWYKESNEDFITKLALFHIKFESIHPFIDGNGRTGRLIINLELMKLGYPPINIKYSDRKAYYDAFNIYHTKKNIKAMSNLFSKYLYESLYKYISIFIE